MERKNKIYAFNSHYEIYDYSLGDNKSLEYDLTFHDWVAYNHTPVYYYDDVNRILYIPRGIDRMLLEEWNGKPVTVVTNTNEDVPIGFKLKKPPRDDNERKAIRYLIGSEEFASTKNDSQKVLIMPPGYGKTYCTIAAIQKLHTRTLVIMHSSNLKKQWMEKFKEYTDMGGVNIVEITSSKQLRGYLKSPPSKNNMVFVVTRKLLISYMEQYGMESLNEVITKMGIGLKVFDEAHKEYRATLLIDYATNVKRTFYLTATFALSDYQDNKIFQASYKLVRKLQIRQDDNLRHIIYIAVLFNTHPNPIEVHKVEGKKRGFDRYQYIDYELEKGVLEDEMREIIKLFKVKNKLDGKILVLSSKKDTCDYFRDVVKSELPYIRSCSIYTNNKIENYKEYDSISATPAMLGTGEDIPGLRFMFNTEPGRSLTNTDQFSGRLRPYMNGEKATYYVEFIDTGFSKLTKMYQTRLKLLKTKVKECYELNKTIRL